MPERVDVLVVGAGPAGAVAAREAARSGARVLVIERRRRVGALPHCAEFVPQALALEEEVPAAARRQAVVGMRTFMGQEERLLAGPGWVLDRQVFDFHLAAQAASVGAEIWCGASLVGLSQDRAVLRRGNERMEVEFAACVAADGAASACARALGLFALELIPGVQVTVPLRVRLDRTWVFLRREIKGGYAWLFPRGEVANLGLGCQPSAQPLMLLEDLRRELADTGVIGPGCLARGGGAIPIGGPRPQPWAGRVLLAGDAAGLTHALTGAGIPQAVFSGAEAGRAALALAGGAGEAAQDYAHALHLRYGRYLSRGLAARQEWDREWRGDFAALMARTWPGWSVPRA